MMMVLVRRLMVLVDVGDVDGVDSVDGVDGDVKSL